MKHWIISGGIGGGNAAFRGCAGPGDRADAGGGSAASMPQAGQEAGSGMQEQAYHKITAEEAKQMMDGRVTVVDVRTEAKYKEGHIPGAVLVPNESIGSEPPEALPELDAVLLVHCRTGVRSKQAADKLVDMGYTQVYDFGGIRDWPYDIVTED